MSNVILVTGVMGSGKTLKVVADLVNDLEENEKRPIEEKRTYYANITGLKIDGILPIPYDWRDTPDHSYIIYDEAQLIPMFKKSRGQSHMAVQELTLARKRGHKIIFITQAPNRLHQDILDVVGEHYHVHRPYGAKLATVFMWRNQVATRPLGRSSQSTIENKFLFVYPKKCYDLYESAQVANDGFRTKIPPKSLLLLSLPILLFGYSAYVFFKPDTQDFLTGTQEKEVSQSLSQTATAIPATTTVEPLLPEPPPAPKPTIEQLEDERVAFVMSMPNGCIAKNSKGFDLDISYETCMKYANKEISMQPSFTTPKQTQHMGNMQPIDHTKEQHIQPINMDKAV